MKREEIIGKLREKLPNLSLGSCPICNQAKWQIAESVNLTTDTSPYSAIPVCILVCTNCGNTQFLSRKILEL